MPLSVSTRLFSSLGELHTISQRSYGTTYTIRPGSRYPITRRTPSPGSPDRGDPLGRFSGYGLPTSPTTPPQTILKSSSLSLPQEPKEVRFVMRSSSARSRSRSPSPSPSHSPGLGSPLLALRPFHQKPLHLWNKYDVGDWLESINLGEHRAGFQEHEIEGSHLPALTKDDFAELGVTRVGHRMNIERALKQLLESWPLPWDTATDGDRWSQTEDSGVKENKRCDRGRSSFTPAAFMFGITNVDLQLLGTLCFHSALTPCTWQCTEEEESIHSFFFLPTTLLLWPIKSGPKWYLAVFFWFFLLRRARRAPIRTFDLWKVHLFP